MSLKGSDSLSSYNSSHDLFHVGKPSAPKTELFTTGSLVRDQKISKDTIEISREKIKEEAMQRLKQPKYLIAQPGFMRIGKYVFMTVSFPPYLLLYGLPKWVIVEALPFLFIKTVWLVKFIKKKLKTPVVAVSNKIVGFFQTAANLGRTLIQPIIRLALDIRNMIRRRIQEVNQFFKKIKNSVFRLIHFPKALLSLNPDKLKEKIKEFTKELTNGISKKIEGAFTYLQKGVQGIKNTFQSLLNLFQNPLENLTEKGAILGLKMANGYRAVYGQAQSATDRFFRQCKNGSEVIGRYLKTLTLGWTALMFPRWSQFKKRSQSIWMRIKEFLQKKSSQGWKYLNNKREALKKLSYLNLLDRMLSTQFFLRLPSKIQELLKKILFHQVIRSLCEKIILGFKTGSDYLLRFLIFIFAMSSKILEHTAYYTAIMGKYLSKWKKLSGRKIDRIAYFTKKGSKIGVYYILLFMIMTSILLVRGIRLLGELMNYLTAKFLFIRPSKNI